MRDDPAARRARPAPSRRRRLAAGRDRWPAPAARGRRGRQSTSALGPVPCRVARWTEHSLPAPHHANQRVQIHGQHRVAGDEDAVTAIQADMTRGVTGCMDGLPVGQTRETGPEMKRVHHVGQVGVGSDLCLRLLRQQPDDGHHPPVEGHRVLGKASGRERQLIGMHVRRLPPVLRQPPDGSGVVRMQVGQQHRRRPGPGPEHRLSRGLDRLLAAGPASVYQRPGQPGAHEVDVGGDCASRHTAGNLGHLEIPHTGLYPVAQPLPTFAEPNGGRTEAKGTGRQGTRPCSGNLAHADADRLHRAIGSLV